MKKHLKRNIVIAAGLVVVGAAVYLNWSYNSKWGGTDASMVAAEDAATKDADASYTETSAQTTGAAYFDEARMTRQKSRDQALELLQQACSQETASQEVVDESMRQINAMAAWNMQESLLENELLAKNFTDCVVMVTDDGITVAVPAPAEGLSETQVAQVTDAVVSNTNFTADKLNIIEVKD